MADTVGEDGKKSGKQKVESEKRTGSLPIGQLTPEELAATQRYLQALFKSVTTAIMFFLAGGVGSTEVLHPFNHNADGSHKTPPITNTTRREDRGNASVKVQPVEDDENPAGGPPLVPCEAVGVGCNNRVPSGFCYLREHLCVVAPHPDRQYGPHGPSEGKAETRDLKLDGPPVKIVHTIGRLEYRAGFKDVWLDDIHYDLRGRAKARFCLQYLVAKQAFDGNSARHLEHEIDPFVRKKCQLPPPSEIRIQHYFNDPSGKLSKLRSNLVKASGRNGRFYLQVV